MQCGARVALTCLALAPACNQGTVVDTPDATLPWPTHHTPLPRSDAGLALVANQGSGDLTVIDLAAAATVGRLRTDVDPVGNDGPSRIAVDPVQRRAYLTLTFPIDHEATGPHASHNQATPAGGLLALDTGDLHELAERSLDPAPGDVVLTPDRSRVLVTHDDLDTVLGDLFMGLPAPISQFWVLDAVDLHRIASLDACTTPFGIATDASGQTAYLACYGEDTLGIVALGSVPLTIERIPVGPSAGALPTVHYGPMSVLVTPDQSFVLVADAEGNDVRVFDIAAHAFDDARALPLHARMGFGSVSADGAAIYFAGQVPSTAVKIRATDLSVESSVQFTGDVCSAGFSASAGPDGKVYMLCQADGVEDGHVLVLDGGDLHVLASIEVGVFPYGLAFLPPAQ